MHIELEDKYPEIFKIQRYEDLVSDLLEETKKLFSFCDLHVDQQTESFVIKSQDRHVENQYAVFKNPKVVDRWRDELCEEIKNEILSEIRGTEFERFAS